MTYDDSNMPTHYGFKIGSGVKRLRDDLASARQRGRDEKPLWTTKRSRPGTSSRLAADAGRSIKSLDSRGAWVEEGSLRARGNDNSPQKIISMRTFAKNVTRLAVLVAATSER